MKFRLDGSLVARSEMTVHKCELSVLVNSIPELSTESNCTKWIKTYYGAFEEACLMPGNSWHCDIFKDPIAGLHTLLPSTVE